MGMRRKGDLPNAFAFAGKAAQLDAAAGWANEAMLEHLGAQRRWREALAMLERRLATGRMDREPSASLAALGNGAMRFGPVMAASPAPTDRAATPSL